MRLALITYDEKKPNLISFAEERQGDPECFELVATSTISQRLIDATGLGIERKQSGPLGGDTQVGAETVSETCDGVIFLRDLLTAQPHRSGITAPLHIYDVRQTSPATNLASADAVLDELIQQPDGEERSSGPSHVGIEPRHDPHAHCLVSLRGAILRLRVVAYP